jgi:hypothetical protein
MEGKPGRSPGTDWKSARVAAKQRIRFDYDAFRQ